jgi:TonB-linked SusC/RagA family outer membrane protein
MSQLLFCRAIRTQTFVIFFLTQKIKGMKKCSTFYVVKCFAKRLSILTMTLLLCLLFTTTQAKTYPDKQITGTVLNDKNEPLSGASVKVKNTNRGTVTDNEGNFTLTVHDADKALIISYSGYADKEVALTGERNITVTLYPSSGTLDEVLVIGYGTVKKSDYTGAIETIKSDRLMSVPGVPNVTQALEGKIAGVDVMINSNAPGSGAKVRIRGNGSINSNIDPLYVVDGVIGVDINTINPNDIESIEALKDGISTAIYGVRGANGVMMVTTKRGRKGVTQFNYEGNVNMAQLYRHLPSLNSDQFLQVYNLTFANSAKFDPLGVGSTPPKPLDHNNYPLLFDASDKPLYSTNWEKEVYKNALSQSHFINIRGGSDKSQYSLSMGYLDQNGIMTQSWFKRYSVRFTMDNDVKDWLRVGGNLNLIRSTQRMVSDANGALNVPRMVAEELPIIPIKYPDGTWGGNSDVAGMEGGANPVNIATNRYTLNNTTQGLGNVYALFHITKELDFRSDFGFTLNSQKNNFYSSMYLHNLSQDQSGDASITGVDYVGWQSENYVTWNKKITDNQQLTAMAGASWYKSTSQNVYAETQNFIDDFFQYYRLQAGSVRNNITSGYGVNTSNSFYARAQYNISGKYFFTAQGRADGSSNFPPSHHYAFFPSVGAAWRISEEDFLKDNATISNLKLRTSYSTTGNQNIPGFGYLTQIGTSQTVLSGSQQTTLLPNVFGNPDLKWETSIQFDAGLELGLLKNRINMTIDYYTRRTKDLILQTPIPSSAGFTNSSMLRNIGALRNNGIEIGFNSTNIQTKDFTWDMAITFAANQNKILSLDDGNADIYPGPNFLGQTNILRVGEPIGSFWGMTRIGTYSDSPEDIAAAAAQGLHSGDRKYIYNADGTPYFSVIGRAYPKWTGNFNSSFKYKNWDFSFDIRFVEGVNTAATFKHSTEDRQTIANSLATVLGAWTPDHQNTMISQVRPYAWAQDSHFDTWWVEDGSFIRGQNFILGYTLPNSALEKAKITKLRFYVSVQNLFIITKYTGYDPEVDTFNSGYGNNGGFSQNMDFFQYPRPRVWNLGLSLNF